MSRTAWTLLAVLGLILAATAYVGGFSGEGAWMTLVLVGMSTLIFTFKLRVLTRLRPPKNNDPPSAPRR